MSVTTIDRSSTTTLVALESTIERGMSSFIDVGNALSAIANEKLYQPDYKDFDEYCQKRWGFSKSTGYNYIKIANADQQLDFARTRDIEAMPTRQVQATVSDALEIKGKKGENAVVGDVRFVSMMGNVATASVDLVILGLSSHGWGAWSIDRALSACERILVDGGSAFFYVDPWDVPVVYDHNHVMSLNLHAHLFVVDHHQPVWQDDIRYHHRVTPIFWYVKDHYTLSGLRDDVAPSVADFMTMATRSGDTVCEIGPTIEVARMAVRDRLRYIGVTNDETVVTNIKKALNL